MKIIKEYDLNDDNDRYVYACDNQSVGATRVLSEIHDILRTEVKHNDTLTVEAYAALYQIKDKLADLLEEYSVNINVGES
jgi:hypothetical protein